MTLLFEETPHGRRRPTGLDWTVCTDGQNDPKAWTPTPPKPAKPKPSKRTEPRDRHPMRMPAELEAEICLRYINGESTTKIAPDVGYSVQAVVTALARNNVQIRPKSVAPSRRLPDGVEERIVAMYVDELKSSGQISRELGIQTRTVARVLDRRNVQVRTRSEATRLHRAQRKAG